ncbi:MAG: glycosyltransferase family 4 protein [Hyphomicrobium aestuarii]|nr:glycosyltransferase family 4 protein [Hyphomicrobium aestuarii]
MKLLMATHYFDSHRGGIEIVAARLAREFTSRGVELTWLASNATPPPDVTAGQGRCVAIPAWNVTERRLGFPLPLPGPRGLLTITREVRDSDAVLLHDCLYPTNVSARLAAWWYRRPVVIIQHIGTVPYTNPVLRVLMATANAIITRPMLASAHQVAFISEITRRHFATVRFASPPRLLFNGVDTQMYAPPEPGYDRASVRARLGLPTDRPVALFVGRFVEKKGLHLIERTARQRPGITFALAGWGPIDPSDWGLANVRVLSGLSGASLADAYRASDIFVLPSTGEGLPLVMQEALASGLPVVCGAETATADPEAARFVDGVAIDPAHHDATAAAFAAAIDQHVDTLAVGITAAERHAFVRDRYSWSRAAGAYLDIVKGLMHDVVSTQPAAAIEEAPRP